MASLMKSSELRYPPSDRTTSSISAASVTGSVRVTFSAGTRDFVGAGIRGPMRSSDFYRRESIACFRFQMSEGERKTTVDGAPVVLPRQVKDRLDKLRDGRPRWIVVEMLLNEHDARSRAATPTTPREEAVA